MEDSASPTISCLDISVHLVQTYQVDEWLGYLTTVVLIHKAGSIRCS